MFRCSNIILSRGDPEYVPEDTDPVVDLLNAGQTLTELMQGIAESRASTPRTT